MVAVVGVGAVVGVPTSGAAAPGGGTPDTATSLGVVDVDTTSPVSSVGVATGALPFVANVTNPVWYVFTTNVTTQVRLRLSSASTGFDVAMEVYERSGSGPYTYTLRAFNDDAASGGDDAELWLFPTTPGTVYVVGVGAGSGSALNTGDGQLFVDPQDEPSAPTAVTATPGNGALTVSWQPPANPEGAITGYVVRHRVAGSTDWSSDRPAAAEDRSATLTGLVNGTAYEVVVLARNVVGMSQPSAVASATPSNAQTITFPDPGPFRLLAGGPITLTATASSALPVSYEASGACTVSGTTLTPTARGLCGVTASQAGDGSWAAAVPVVRQLLVLGDPQTITFDPAPPASVTFGAAALPLVVVSDAGLDVTVQVAGPCALSAGMLSFTGAGACTLTANQAGDATHEPAGPTVATVTVERAPTVVTLSPTVLSLTRTRVEVEVTSGSTPVTGGALDVTIGGVLYSTTAPGFSVEFDTVAGLSLPATATYAGTADFLPSSTSEVIDTRLAQTIGLDALLPDRAPVLTTLELPDETEGEHLPVTSLSTTPAVCTVSGTTLTLVAPGTCSVESSNPGDATRAGVLEGVSFTVTRRAQTIELVGPAATWTGAGASALRARSSADLPVTVSVSGPACRYDGALWFVDVGECVVTATSAGDALTEPAEARLRTVVSAGPQHAELHVTGRVGDRAAGLAVWGWLGTGRPGSPTTLTVESTPVLLARAEAGWDGGAVVNGVLPALPAGTHRIVITGTTLDGRPVQAALAFGVGADGRITWIGQPGARGRLAATGADVGTTVPLAVLLLVGGIGLLGVRRRLLVTQRA